MRLYAVLTIASLKMYFRNRQAIFWALFFPMLIMVIFGLMNFDRFSPPDVGIVDRADSELSAAFIQAVDAEEDPLFDVTRGQLDNLLEELRTGDLDAVVVLPEGFGEGQRLTTVQVTYDSRKPQEHGVVQTVISEVLDNVFLSIANIPDEFRVESRFAIDDTSIEGKGEGFRGFLVPGVAAMAIMQSGIFGVVFSLIRYKTGGVLRRLRATPIGPSHFLVGQIATRLIVTVLQTYVLLIAGVLVLGVSIGDGTAVNWLDLTILAIFGGALFNTMGLAVSGWAKSEDVAAPVANIISLPMMFLSGVFFPLEILPGWLANVSRFFPLTYLADGMREITVNGSSIATLGPELAGLGAWTAVVFLLATRLFRWE